MKSKIQNILIEGNKNLSDEYIIEKANLEDYPSYFKNLSFSNNLLPHSGQYFII